MPWELRGARRQRRRAIWVAAVTFPLIAGSILALWIAYARPPCSLEAEPLLRQLDLCR